MICGHRRLIDMDRHSSQHPRRTNNGVPTPQTDSLPWLFAQLADGWETLVMGR
jgi:hypothetical protein